jgi:hypothetical protein
LRMDFFKRINSFTGLGKAWSLQKFEASGFKDSRYMNMVRLSAIRTGCLYLLENISWYSFLLEAESTLGP